MAITRPLLDSSDDFPIQDDLANLLDVMEQLPVEDVDSEGNRIRATPQPSLVQGIDEWYDGEPSIPTSLKLGRKKPLSKKKGAIKEEEGSVKPVIKDTSEDEITSSRLREIATDIFGEERVDVQEYKDAYTLIVHFPDFIITNGNHEHRIRDLYVLFSVSHTAESTWSVGLAGLRSTLTLSEYNSHYAHSHLPAHNGGIAESFCQGTSQFRAITTGLSARPTEGQWELALLSLERFVTWESLEGGPHIRMGTITSRIPNQNSNYAAEFKCWVDQIPLEVFDLQEGLQVNRCSDRLREFYNDVSSIRGPRASSNNTEAVRNAQINWDNQFRIQLSFKGQPLKMKIILDDGLAENSFIDQVVIDHYNLLLQNQLANFNKRINYEHLRFRNRDRLGKVPTFQQADINHYKATTGKDRAAARARRKQGVVGRVNNLRKREDHRFG